LKNDREATTCEFLRLGVVIITILSLVAASLIGCQHYAPVTTSPPLPTPPSAPSNLTTEAVSHSTAQLRWMDNSDDEQGFKIYRDKNLVATVHANVTTYQDTGLKPATNYQYEVTAYNQAGESSASSCTVRTPNPPITIRLDRIGVYDNREVWLRGEDGEVYIYVVVSDGNTITEGIRFPQQEGQHYKLMKNETVDIGAIIFSTDEVGDSLTLTIVGYEDDGGGFEPLVYEALGIAVESQMSGGAGGLLEAFDFSLGGLIAQFFGAEDDWLGSYEQTWNYNNNWGIGGYTDIACEDERGVLCLRLWFTIESLVESLEPAQMQDEEVPTGLPSQSLWLDPCNMEAIEKLEDVPQPPYNLHGFYMSRLFYLSGEEILDIKLEADCPVSWEAQYHGIERANIWAEINLIKEDGKSTGWSSNWTKSVTESHTGRLVNILFGPTNESGFYAVFLINWDTKSSHYCEYFISLKE